MRPVRVDDPNRLADSVAYDAAGGSWNTVAHIRLGDTAVTRSYYDRFGRADSVVDPIGVRTRFIRDRLGRVLYQKTGTGDKAPTARTWYDPAGLVYQTDVYASGDEELATPLTGTLVQSTRTFYDALGRVDSVVGPGSRTGPSGAVRARKHSYRWARNATPAFEYPGNGSMIVRLADWAGRVNYVYHSQVAPYVSLDGERFADDSTIAMLDYVGMRMADGYSAGQVYGFTYDNKGRRVSMAGRDMARSAAADTLSTKRWTYSRTGAVTSETTVFRDGLRQVRRYEYNRRGQRTLAVDTVTATRSTDAISGDRIGRTEYYYDATTGRLDSLVATGSDGVTTTPISRVRWRYDRGGRDSVRTLTVGTSLNPVVTRYTYDAAGRARGITAQQTVNGTPTTWYQFGTTAASYDKADRLLSHTSDEPSGRHATMTNLYTTDGTGRLRSTTKNTGATGWSVWEYDVFGNRTSEETKSVASPQNCASYYSLQYAPDNRLAAMLTPGACGASKRFWSDQTGSRLVQLDTVFQGPILLSEMTYTAAGQLYFSLTPQTDQLGHYDVNWNWYDGDGVRIVTHSQELSVWDSLLTPTTGDRRYYFYDGSDVGVTVQGIPGVTQWKVLHRFVVGGVDEPIAGRFLAPNGSVRTLGIIGDRTNTPLALLSQTDSLECDAGAVDRNAFGQTLGGTGGWCGIHSGVGFAGASTPNQKGGYTYLRNRWYDPQTGRFLTQDPIGLAGGVNLYAYAGNNPVNYSDPFGLKECPHCFGGGGGFSGAGSGGPIPTAASSSGARASNGGALLGRLVTAEVYGCALATWPRCAPA